jgi:hypothetical protein
MLWLLQRQRRACARATRGLVFQSQPSPPSHGALFAFYSVVSVSQPPAGCFFELIFHLWPIDAQVPAHEPSRPERRPHSATAAGTSFALAVTPTRLFTLHLFLQADSFCKRLRQFNKMFSSYLFYRQLNTQFVEKWPIFL